MFFISRAKQIQHTKTTTTHIRHTAKTNNNYKGKHDTAKTKTPLNYAKDALKIATIPARFLLNIKSPKDPLENFADYNMSPTDEVSSAISDYKKALELDPEDIYTQNNLIILEEKRNKRR